MAQIPPPSDNVWDRLVSGKITHKFGLFAANMAVARAVRIAAADPARKSVMVAEVHQFFSRFADELAAELRSLN
jgi:hypothetical protein